MSRNDYVARALIAVAARDGLEGPPDWDDIAAAIQLLRDDPDGPRRMRLAMRQVNNSEVRSTLKDWFDRQAEQEEEFSRDAHRLAEKIVQPIQMVFASGALAVLIGAAAGTIAAPVAMIAGTAAAATALLATAVRWRLSRQGDAADRNGRRTARLSSALDIASVGR